MTKTEWNADGCLVPWTIILGEFRIHELMTDLNPKSAWRFWPFWMVNVRAFSRRMRDMDITFLCFLLSFKSCKWCHVEGFSPKECVMCYHLHLLGGGGGGYLEHVAELTAEWSVQPVCLRQAHDKEGRRGFSKFIFLTCTKDHFWNQVDLAAIAVPQLRSL